MAKSTLFAFLVLVLGAVSSAGCGGAYVSGSIYSDGCWVDGMWYSSCPAGIYGPRVRYYHPAYCPPYCPPGYRHPPMYRHPPVYRHPPGYRPVPPHHPRHAPPPGIRHAPPAPKSGPPHSHLPYRHHGQRHAHFHSLP